VQLIDEDSSVLAVEITVIIRVWNLSQILPMGHFMGMVIIVWSNLPPVLERDPDPGKQAAYFGTRFVNKVKWGATRKYAPLDAERDRTSRGGTGPATLPYLPLSEVI
jgi:hypothetical protein